MGLSEYHNKLISPTDKVVCPKLNEIDKKQAAKKVDSFFMIMVLNFIRKIGRDSVSEGIYWEKPSYSASPVELFVKN